ncbi:MAG: family 10 glycosylhydrolase [Armatimonadetes bacterium]|nr:family 10 glycosylhydrolase [Armatimonadota bacterium]
MISLMLYAMLSGSERPAGPAMREFRAAWVATVANIDWPSEPGLSNAELRKEMITILDRCEENNFNAIIFQVRPGGDAMYKSDLEPWSYFLTGEQGKAPADGWDPLSFIVDEAHDRGIEVHCWFNPYRAKHAVQKTGLAPLHLKVRKPDIVKQYGDYLWMDPGEKEVQDHSFNVFMDVVERYDIDGIHIDDYFYPYPSYAGGEDFPDGPSWKKYTDGGGELDRGDWRRKNVNDFVKRVYEGIKRRKRWVKFGVSPFGLYRPGHPEGITRTAFDQYETLYADCRLWFREGWLDYYTPQLYWPMEGDMSYKTLLDYWMGENRMNRHLWPGNYSGRIRAGSGTYPRGNWPVQELIDQIEYTREVGAMGNVFFSMKSFTQDFKGVNKVLTNGVYKKKALVPASPWLDSTPPPMPACSLNNSTGRLTLRGAYADARYYAVYADFGEGLDLIKVTSSGRGTLTGLSLNEAQTVMVSIVDRAGNESKLQTVNPVP